LPFNKSILLPLLFLSFLILNTITDR